MIATSIDANGHIFPLAFAIVEEESSNSWYWFIYILRSQVTQREAYVSFSIVMQEYKSPLGILVLDGTRLIHTIDIVLGMWQAASMINIEIRC